MSTGEGEGKGMTAQERVALAYAILETFKDAKLDAREMSTTLILALTIVWNENELPVELFDQMMATASHQIFIANAGMEPRRPS